ncbi:hypothetical protein LSG31_02675 [Fodinisporobacter ferrooxydans]|uniref:Uncharacterized protein n=1 Tax=Fodinisporobacter ferrooxydans TaxID=2901836 RepID=A0ABY4CKY9_9BACL|nr:hypothetical protein LSG31_02675 [Alicyclobacillaceae bacterium MYW30-H2]
MENKDIDLSGIDSADQASAQAGMANKVKMEELAELAARLGHSSPRSQQSNSFSSAADGLGYEFDDVSDVYY